MEATKTNEATKTEARLAIEALPENVQLREVIKKVNELVAKANASVRDRGPDSTREMKLEDAERVVFGDAKDLKHNEAAEKLGLSYGQVYSARGGYTFKSVHKRWKALNPDREMAGPKTK